jgi:adenylate kinase family enzyme
MARVLVTGMSGTGKSTVLLELAQRGVRVVDTDEDGWSTEHLVPGGAATEQVWNADRMTQLLARAENDGIVVSGCASNQGSFYDRFDAVVLLAVPRDVLLERIATRTNNPFGRDPIERERILADLDQVEPLLRATSTLEIDGTQPVGAIADRIQALVRQP